MGVVLPTLDQIRELVAGCRVVFSQVCTSQRKHRTASRPAPLTRRGSGRAVANGCKAGNGTSLLDLLRRPHTGIPAPMVAFVQARCWANRGDDVQRIKDAAFVRGFGEGAAAVWE